MPKCPVPGLVPYNQLGRGIQSAERVPTGYRSLDTIIGPGGYRVPCYGLLAARPSMGKTSLAINMLRRMRGLRAMLSLEMDKTELFEQIDKQVVENPGGFYITDELITLPQLTDAIAELGKAGFKFVVLDYINIIAVPGRIEVDNAGMAVISKELRRAARQAGVCLLAIAQLNRDLEHRGDPRPKMSDLRDSGSLEQDADLILMLHSDAYHRPNDAGALDDLEVLVVKQRMGKRGVTVYLEFDRDRCNITETAAQRPTRDEAAIRAARQERDSADLSTGADAGYAAIGD